MDDNLLDGVLDGGFGMLRNTDEIMSIEELDCLEEKKAYIKELWLENPRAYYQWKSYCINCEKLPELFGTKDNPIHIDESKL